MDIAADIEAIHKGPPDSFWGKPLSALTEKYPRLTPDVMAQWQLLAKELGVLYSGHPGRAKFSTLIVNPDNELVSLGVNNLVGGIQLTPDYADKTLYYAHCLCAEQGALTACARCIGASSTGAIAIQPVVPCEGCAKNLIAAEVGAIVSDPADLLARPNLLEYWAPPLALARAALLAARNPEVMSVSSRIPEGAELKIDIRKLELNTRFNGVAFARPLPFESLLAAARNQVSVPAAPLNS